MKILVTGAKGFIGKNLVAELKNREYTEIFEFDIDNDISLLDEYTKECDFVFHLAGVNRPKDDKEFMKGNYDFTRILLEKLSSYNNKATIIMTSSIQAELDNSYGKSKKAGEEALLEFSKKAGNNVLIYRLSNVFGKWCRPNFNSVVATFCYNIANGLEIIINNKDTVLNLIYIDDVINEFFDAMRENVANHGEIRYIQSTHSVSLGRIAELIYQFKDSRHNLYIPDMSDEFTKKLYSTYLSYLPESNFSYQLKMNEDSRGSFTEFIKSSDRGQVSINISKPGIVKGNHWHHTKNEKFLVVSGKGLIRLRKINSDIIHDYYVSGDKLEVVDIPVGYTHCIINEGDTDMVTVMWANEEFNSNKPDTYYTEVIK